MKTKHLYSISAIAKRAKLDKRTAKARLERLGVPPAATLPNGQALYSLAAIEALQADLEEQAAALIRHAEEIEQYVSRRGEQCVTTR